MLELQAIIRQSLSICDLDLVEKHYAKYEHAPSKRVRGVCVIIHKTGFKYIYS